MIESKLLKILACPICKGSLRYDLKPKEKFFCKRCKINYPVQKGIPNFIPPAGKVAKKN